MRTTITINDKLLLKLKRQALESDETVSSLIEQAVTQQLLEDLEDVESLVARKDEQTMTYGDFVAELKAEGLL